MKVENHVFVNQMEEKRKLGSGKKVKGFLPNLLGGIKLKNGNLQKDTVSFGSPVIYKDVISKNIDQAWIDSFCNFLSNFEDITEKLRQTSLHRRIFKNWEVKDKKFVDNIVKETRAEKRHISTYFQFINSFYKKNPDTGKWVIDKDDAAFIKKIEKDDDQKYRIEESDITILKHFVESGYIRYLGGGVSGDAYEISIDGEHVVIKEAKEKKCTNPIYGHGGIQHEFEMLKEFADNNNFQQGIALLGTQYPNYFLISRFEEGHPAGKNKSGFNYLTDKEIDQTLNTLQVLDKQNMFNADWNIGNIFYRGDNYNPKLLDLQWLYPTEKANNFFNFVPGEQKTNMVSFESGAIASYMHHLYDYTKSKDQARDFLRMYLQKRANYCDTSNRFERIRKAVYQNPSEDVLDAEILRLSILKNHNHQFLYADKRCEEPRDMLKMLRYQARANFAAKQLSEFQPQRPYSETSRAEDEYFEEMRDFGKYWHQKTQEWYKGTIKWMENLVLSNGRCQNNNTGYFYFPEKFGKGDKKEQNAGDSAVSDKTMLSDVLSNGASRQYTRSFKKIRSKITELEANFMDLKQAVDKNDNVSKNDAKEDIEDLISEVLV